MNTREFYELKWDHEGIPAGTVVQSTDYVQTFVGTDDYSLWVQYPVEGEFHRAWIPKGKLVLIAPPDSWLSEDYQ